VKRLLILGCVAVVAAVAVATYVRIGWSRMDDTCNADQPGARHQQLVDQGWSWRPPGFRCAYADGSHRTSLWP
jgi:hypothetical protein